MHLNSFYVTIRVKNGKFRAVNLQSTRMQTWNHHALDMKKIKLMPDSQKQKKWNWLLSE